MAAGPRSLISREAYLAMERESEERYEYIAGAVYAMDGGTAARGLDATLALPTLDCVLALADIYDLIEFPCLGGPFHKHLSGSGPPLSSRERGADRSRRGEVRPDPDKQW